MTRCLSLRSIAVIVLAALPMMAAQSDLLDLAAGSVVVSYTSQYSDSWAALLLLDGTTKSGSS